VVVYFMVNSGKTGGTVPYIAIEIGVIFPEN
jgi:hypothetical protein